MDKKFLPIGTVCTIEQNDKPIMIIGYYPITQEKNVYDYSGCYYPFGIVKPNNLIVFNHEAIKNIAFNGYSTLQSNDFLEKIQNIKKEEMLSRLKNKLEN